jgi:hypothetical protein
VTGGAQAPTVTAAASLSECHNSDNSRILNGSQAKTAFALRLNASEMVQKAGLRRCGFLTLTVGDYLCHAHGRQVPSVRDVCPVCGGKMRFTQVFDSKEGSRRIDNLRRRFLSSVFRQLILVSERHASGALHYHALVVLSADEDIRSGFDHGGIGRGRNYRSASPFLRGVWREMRRVLPGYGFGRSELTPIKKEGGAVASYISKYLEKNIGSRLPADKGCRLVRYHGFGHHLRANDFEWDSDAARDWRSRVKAVLGRFGLPCGDVPVQVPDWLKGVLSFGEGRARPKCFDVSGVSQVLGSRWAFQLSSLLASCGFTKGPSVAGCFARLDIISRELQRLAGSRWCRDADQKAERFMCGVWWGPDEWRGYWEGLTKYKGKSYEYARV